MMVGGEPPATPAVLHPVHGRRQQVEPIERGSAMDATWRNSVPSEHAANCGEIGGGTGIRTQERVSPLTVFKSHVPALDDASDLGELLNSYQSRASAYYAKLPHLRALRSSQGQSRGQSSRFDHRPCREHPDRAQAEPAPTRHRVTVKLGCRIVARRACRSPHQDRCASSPDIGPCRPCSCIVTSTRTSSTPSRSGCR